MYVESEKITIQKQPLPQYLNAWLEASDIAVSIRGYGSSPQIVVEIRKPLIVKKGIGE